MPTIHNSQFKSIGNRMPNFNRQLISLFTSCLWLVYQNLITYTGVVCTFLIWFCLRIHEQMSNLQQQRDETQTMAMQCKRNVTSHLIDYRFTYYYYIHKYLLLSLYVMRRYHASCGIYLFCNSCLHDDQAIYTKN